MEFSRGKSVIPIGTVSFSVNVTLPDLTRVQGYSLIQRQRHLRGSIVEGSRAGVGSRCNAGDRRYLKIGNFKDVTLF